MNFWFVAGSQHLYGEDTLLQVSSHSRHMAEEWNKSGRFPYKIVWKETVKTPEEISDLVDCANFDRECAGIIVFMHTFSPSKMWIAGLSRLGKPYCHLHTQFNREIPWDSIDMDFMNLNQSAHGDREHGFLGARLRMPRAVIVGYWESEEVQKGLADFMRAAAGVHESRRLKVARFGDNMREVAVTEGDKIEAQIRLGWSVNAYPTGDLLQIVNEISERQIEESFEKLRATYTLATSDLDAIRYQLKLEAGMRKFLEDGGFGAFTTNFEDLRGFEQLPGLSVQLLMADGYGFGAEGDWKTAALTRILKVMGGNAPGGTSFMEDYTYHLEEGNEMVLGAHMLEVCPSIASDRPCVETAPLSIGGKNPPARLTFTAAGGDAILTSLIDVGGRFRMIVQDIQLVPPPKPMPRLPVAKAMWKPLPSLPVAAKAWILAGGAHHTALSSQLTAGTLRGLAEMLDIEWVHIQQKTDLEELKKELLWNDLAYKLR